MMRVHPLGIQPRDENKTEDMVGIMKELQKYVPMVETVKNLLAGLIPVVADWHTKVKLLEVIWTFFYSNSFRRQWYIRNKLNRTNVPKKDVNACVDFIEIFISSLVIATVMTTLQLKSANDFSSDGVYLGPKLFG
ncbi:hypothetical protein EMCRGX_G018990 [Ephydatia muelleri]